MKLIGICSGSQAQLTVPAMIPFDESNKQVALFQLLRPSTYFCFLCSPPPLQLIFFTLRLP